MIENIIKNISRTTILTKFLTLEEQSILTKQRCSLLFFPEDCERKRALVSLDDIQNRNFEIDLLKISYNHKFGSIGHRDVLGAVLGLGIKRECIGDILVDDCIYIFIIKEMSIYIIDNLLKIGNVYVNVEMSSIDDIKDINRDNYIEDQLLVSSYRLDTIVSERTNLSREKSKQYIQLKNVKVNGIININPDYIVKIDDLISIHRYGRLIVKEEIRKTKKDKIVIKILKTR